MYGDFKQLGMAIAFWFAILITGFFCCAMVQKLIEWFSQRAAS